MIKTMNIKMATKPQLSTTESKKNKQSKQPEQEQNQSYREHLDGYQLGGRKGENGRKGAGIKKHESVGTKLTGGG